MELNNELMACYLDGDATQEELVEVRDYLCHHPEEFESMIALMDEDKDDYLDEWSEEEEIASLCDDENFSDISLSAAAFAPSNIQFSRCISIKTQNIETKNLDTYNRLVNMLSEIEELNDKDI